jgi:redox-sensitive bicupin YhaK (pirin superfamily)
MVQLRPAAARGQSRQPWLDSRHTFSFGDYHDDRFPHFRALRVINEDRVAPGAGFSPHGHRDMEILSYVISGALEHRDSLGNGSVIQPGEIQRMTAGSGIRHSEFNASTLAPVHFLQIWIEPECASLPPSYEQTALPPLAEHEARLDVIASRQGGYRCVKVHQDVTLWRASFGTDAAQLSLPLAAGRHAWVQAVQGAAEVNGVALAAGDGLALSDESAVAIVARSGAQLLVFDLA